MREVKEMTQEEVALKANISRSFYTHIEKGDKSPSVKTAKAIGQTLNFKWEIFFEDKCSNKEHYILEINGSSKEVS